MKMSTYDQHQLANILVITNIVTIHYFELDKDFRFAGERHDFWELVYADRGDLLINADGKELVLHTGEIIFTSPMNSTICAVTASTPRTPLWPPSGRIPRP